MPDLMADAAHDREARSALSNPAGFTHPERLAACFPVPLSQATLAALRGSRRLAGRLSERIAARHPLAGLPPELDPQAVRLALMPTDRLPVAARLAGAVWHAGSVRSLILGDAVAELVAAIGADAHGFALRNADMAVETVSQSSASELAAAIERDGLRCLGAWCAAQPPGIGARVLLMLPPATVAEDPVEPVFAERGPAIFIRALEELASDAGE